MASIAATVLLGIQMTGNYWTYLYLAWVVPCIVAGLLADGPRPAPEPVTARKKTRVRTPEPASA
jgi:hypothetical protein